MKPILWRVSAYSSPIFPKPTIRYFIPPIQLSSHPTSSIQHPASSIQHPASSIQKKERCKVSPSTPFLQEYEQILFPFLFLFSFSTFSAFCSSSFSARSHLFNNRTGRTDADDNIGGRVKEDHIVGLQVTYVDGVADLAIRKSD